MKKYLLLIPLLFIGSFTFAEGFPSFPMTIHGNIKIGSSDLAGGTLKIYNSFNQELTSYNISQSGKYGSDNVSVLPLLLNSFDGSLNFKVLYNGKTYIVDSIDDSNKGVGCPSKSSITFVSENCRYDIILKEQISNSGGGSGSGGGGGNETTTYYCKNLPSNASANNNKTPKSNTNYYYSTDTSKECTFQCKNGYTWNEKTTKCEKVVVNSNTGDVKNDKVSKDDKTSRDDENLQKEESLNKGDDDKIHNSFDLSRFNKSNPVSIMLNGYSVEFNNAYEFSHRVGITTIDSIEKANMNGSLTRIAMAKMLSNYAINILGKKPSNSVVPNFPDVSQKLNADYGGAVTLAYQLGIMGKGTNKFRPNDTVTRAELATALSRLLYGTKDGNDKYYTTHIKKLKEKGIITKDNPNIKEKRGNLMLMLMRTLG